MKKSKWSGVYTAVITPFQKNGSIDFKAYKKILDQQIKAKVSGVIPCGTTGESPTLSKEEKKELILFTLNHLKGTGLQTLPGTGSNNTKETVEFSKWASDQGVDGVLVVVPYYNKPSQEGLKNHFKKIADSVDCDVVLYNVPGRTITSLTAETIAALAQHKKITALKEATGNVAFTTEIFDALKKTPLSILSGDDPTFLPLLSVGATGIISVASNIIPKQMVELDNLHTQGKFKQALALHQKYFPIFRDLFIEANPVPVKHAMAWMGICSHLVREPLTGMSSSNQARLKKSLKTCGVL